MTTGQAGQSQSTIFWNNHNIGAGLLGGGGVTASQGLLMLSQNAGAVNEGVTAYSSVTTAASVDALAATAIADTAVADAAFGTAYVGALDGTLLGGISLFAGGSVAGAEAGAIAFTGLASFGLPLLIGVGLGVAAAGACVLLYDMLTEKPQPPAPTPVTPPRPAPTPATISPQNVPQGVPVPAPPVNTTPPTYGPPALGADLISSTGYTVDTITQNGLLGGVLADSPPYPNSFAGLMANSAAGYFADPWMALANQISAMPGVQLGTGPALTASNQVQTNPNTGEKFFMDQITNPANGQGDHHLRTEQSTFPRLLHRADQRFPREQDSSTTTTISVDENTGVATLAFNQSVGAYAPHTWPPGLASVGPGPIYGGGGTGAGTGTGGSTGAGTQGAIGTDGTDQTDGTDSTDGRDAGVGSMITGGTGLGSGSG
jgi:hypothetical protein